jgi:DNA repair protein RadC
MVAHNHPQQDLTPSSGVSEDSYSVLTYINKINLKKKNFKKRKEKVCATTDRLKSES